MEFFRLPKFQDTHALQTRSVSVFNLAHHAELGIGYLGLDYDAQVAEAGVHRMERNSNAITRRIALAMIAGATIAGSDAAYGEGPRILVHKDPNCGCCSKWAAHLKAAGFSVTVEETADLVAVRKRLGVPTDLAGCHTAEASGYVVEGHVPAVAIRRLLEQRPAAVGLAVPGMPAGSPGMEGGTPRRYEVVLFGKGDRRPFMQFVGSQDVG